MVQLCPKCGKKLKHTSNWYPRNKCFWCGNAEKDKEEN